MAANTLFSDPYAYFPDNRPATTTPGAPLVGWKMTVTIAGTATPTAVYHDSALGSAWTQPIVGNAAGLSDDPIFVPPTPALKILVTDADDVTLPGFPMDNWSPSAVAT